MATIAVFLALSGAGAWAATRLKLATNSVLSRHIRDGQVRGADLADGAVGGAKIAAGAVTGDKVLDGTLSGLDLGLDSLGPDEVDESSLGIVPQANQANTADSALTADSATTAETASALGGIEARTIQFRKDAGDGVPVLILDLGGLILTAECAFNASETLTVTATTTKNNAAFFASTASQSGITNGLDRNFTTDDSMVISGPTPGTSTEDSRGFQGTFTYTSPEQPPSVVSMTFGGAEDALSNRETACVFNGTAFHHLTS